MRPSDDSARGALLYSLQDEAANPFPHWQELPGAANVRVGNHGELGVVNDESVSRCLGSTLPRITLRVVNTRCARLPSRRIRLVGAGEDTTPAESFLPANRGKIAFASTNRAWESCSGFTVGTRCCWCRGRRWPGCGSGGRVARRRGRGRPGWGCGRRGWRSLQRLAQAVQVVLRRGLPACGCQKHGSDHT